MRRSHEVTQFPAPTGRNCPGRPRRPVSPAGHRQQGRAHGRHPGPPGRRAERGRRSAARRARAAPGQSGRGPPGRPLTPASAGRPRTYLAPSATARDVVGVPALAVVALTGRNAAACGTPPRTLRAALTELLLRTLGLSEPRFTEMQGDLDPVRAATHRDPASAEKLVHGCDQQGAPGHLP
jgi:hypothetical protein